MESKVSLISHSQLPREVETIIERADTTTAVFKRRWFILLLFSLTIFLNQAQYTAFVTVVKETSDFYGVGSLAVNMLSAVYSAIYVVAVFPTCLLYERVGFRAGTLLGGGANVVSAGLKLVSAFSPHYGWLITGQIFGGVSQVLMLALPPLLSSLWFPAAERTLATAVGTLSGFLGIAFSFFFSPAIIAHEADERHFLVLWAVHSAASLAVFVLCVFVIRDHPPVPPSVTARTAERAPMTARQLLALLRRQAGNFSFMRLCLGFGLMNGTITALATVLGQVVGPSGVGEVDVGNVMTAAIVIGSACCALFAPLVDRYRVYKAPLAVLYAVATVCFVAVAAAVQWGGGGRALLAGLYTAMIILEMCILPSVSIGLEFGVEKTFPDPELVGSSVLVVSLSVWAYVLSLVFSAILGDNPGKAEGQICCWLSAGLALVSFGLVLTVKEERRRRTCEDRSDVSLP